LHAGALERDGKALLMPALPGSGKSTLTAALAHRGWRLLSDEFGALDPQARMFHAMLKPVALKNTSIDVIRRFEPAAVFGPSFPNTRKGTVAHMAAPVDAVDRRNQAALPGAFLFPKWQAGESTRIEAMAPHDVFSAMAFNSFNYNLLGEVAFDAALDLARRCPGWRLVYSDLDDAIARLDELWREHVPQAPAGS
jgi:HprK-related kinase A